jgi:Aldehyde dehydrogenase family
VNAIGRVREGLAAYFYSRDTGRIWRVAEGLEYGIVGINESIISPKRPAGEIAPFGGIKESGIGPSGAPLGLEIRHRGIPRSQIPLHGRHRPVMPHCSAAEDEGSRKPSHPVLSHLHALHSVNASEMTAAVVWG